MHIRIVSAASIIALGVTLAACGGVRSGTGLPMPVMNCSAPPVPQLLYPISGSNNAPDGGFTMIFAVSPQSLAWWAQTPVLMPGATGAALSVAASPYPSPMASAPPGTTLYGSTVPALANATTYTVAFGQSAPAGCLPPGAGAQPLGISGTFTTK